MGKMNNSMTMTERVILSMISNTLFGVPRDLIDNVDGAVGNIIRTYLEPH
jgi:hypothetical protein